MEHPTANFDREKRTGVPDRNPSTAHVSHVGQEDTASPRGQRACAHSANERYRHVTTAPFLGHDKGTEPTTVCPVCLGAGLRYALQNPDKPKVAPDSIHHILDKDSFQAGEELAKHVDLKQKSLFYNFQGNRAFKPRLSAFASYNNPPVVTVKNPWQRVTVEEGGRQPAATKESVYQRYLFKVVDGMNGEAYHGIVANLLARTDSTNFAIKLSLDLKDGKFPKAKESQQDLVNAYVQDNSIFKTNSSKSSWSNRTASTRIIAKYFGISPNNEKQGEIFGKLVEFLNYEAICQATLPVCHEMGDFTSPAYLAGFYMDEYLRITKQEPLPNHTKHPNLPVIAILVRRSGPSSSVANDMRYMNPKNLKATLLAIALAFKSQYGSPDSSTLLSGAIVLMGDIGHEESVNSLRELLPHNLSLHCISSPFCPKPQGDVAYLWENFKSNAEYIPQEVKMWGIYMALKKRYGSHFGIIGWRSGSLDGAGFLGIPTFWYDNIPNREDHYALQRGHGAAHETDQESEDKEQFDLGVLLSDGNYLFRTESTTHPNTFYYKRIYDLSDFERKLEENNGGEKLHSERMEELAVVLHNFILINVSNKWAVDVENGKDTLVLNDTAIKHLSEALQVFLLSDLGDQQKTPVWTRRLELMDKPELAAAFGFARKGEAVHQKYPHYVHQVTHIPEVKQGSKEEEEEEEEEEKAVPEVNRNPHASEERKE